MASNTLTSFEPRAGAGVRSAIEAFPHIVDRLCALWATAEFDDYAGRLLTDSRDGQRQGFPPAVAGELLLLVQVNKLVRAIDLARAKKISLQEAVRRIETEDTARQGAAGFDNPSLAAQTRQRERTTPAPMQAGASGRTSRKPESVGAPGRLTALLFSKTFWLLVVLALSAKLIWPYVR